MLEKPLIEAPDFGGKSSISQSYGFLVKGIAALAGPRPIEVVSTADLKVENQLKEEIRKRGLDKKK